MKIQSYEKVIDKDIIAVKSYLLKIGESYWKQDLDDVINSSIDIRIIRNKINKRKDLQLLIFSKIKRLIDDSVDFDEMENHLIFNYIIDKGGFSVETYCLIRHLINFNEKIIESLIDALANRLNLDFERYHYLASYILLLEKEYKKAYLHLEYITIDHSFERFLPALYNFSPRLYLRYSKKKHMPLNLATG